MISYISSFVVLLAVLCLHMYGLTGPYFTVEGYDIMMHFLGGVGIGLLVLALFNSSRFLQTNRTSIVIAGVIFVGIVWELFEYFFDLTGYPIGTKLYYIDTIKDLIMDTLGAVIVLYFVKKIDARMKTRPVQIL